MFSACMVPGADRRGGLEGCPQETHPELSLLAADASLGALPLAPDPAGRRQDAVRVGLARGDVVNLRRGCIADYGIVLQRGQV